jgi:hypothetical protein
MTAKRILAVVFSLSVLAAAAPLPGADGPASKFQIRLYGGLSYLTGGDANDGVGGIMQGYADEYSSWGFPVSGSFSAAHLGMSFGGDFIFQITPNFGIGVGAGYMQASKESTITIVSMGTLVVAGKPSFNALPVKLGLFFTFPMGRSMDFNFNVGGGYYIGKMTSMIRLSEGSDFEEIDNNAKANGFGFQGGIGFDFRVASSVFLFIEAQGQMADFGKFEGTSVVSDSSGFSQTETGKLYYLEEHFSGSKLYPFIIVAATQPSGSGIFNVREAKVNFNGGQIVAGILIKL